MKRLIPLADFMKPASGTPGVNNGVAGPVFNDFHGNPRTTIDVGAVER